MSPAGASGKDGGGEWGVVCRDADEGFPVRDSRAYVGATSCANAIDVTPGAE